jgi:predicted transcriptional regulator YheO
VLTVAKLPAINPKLKPFVPIVHGLAKILGKDYEVNLHDLSIPERSLVICENGHVTGRKPGSPMTDFGLFMMKSEDYKTKDGVYNYLARNNRGELIKCSCIFIRDNDEKLIGFLCINYDISKAAAARELVESLLHFDENISQYHHKMAEKSPGRRRKAPVPVHEWFAQDINEVVTDSLTEVKKGAGKPLNYLSKPEKQAVIKELYDRGFFQLKGAVEVLAKEMDNTKYTIYSYVREVQNKETEKD